MSILDVRNLSITYDSQEGPVPAVRGVSFTIDRGEVLGLAGESGCGKSTIGHSLLRLHPPGTKIEGEILLKGQDVLTMSPREVGAARWSEESIIFQGAQHSLDPVIKIGSQIIEAIQAHEDVSQKTALLRAGELLERVGIPSRRINDYPHEFSGGQKQRVMIAMALACNPSLVIADEPTTALDVMVQAQVLKLLKELQNDLGVSMLFITHDLSVLVEVSDRLAVMYAGKIVENGPAKQVFTDPIHPYTKALAAAFPEIGDESYIQAPTGLDGDPPDPRNLPTGCSFHPRCAEAFNRCQKVEPESYPAGPEREAACLLIEPGTVGAAPSGVGSEEP